RPAPSVIYTLSLHDALPISSNCMAHSSPKPGSICCRTSQSEFALRKLLFSSHTRKFLVSSRNRWTFSRSKTGCGTEFPAKISKRDRKHTSELQSPDHLVCRL